jgi:AbrB family looped-hinge helix DNA binding protein
VPTATSKLTRKFQATIPQAVRKKLKLNTGDIVDIIAFEIDRDIIRQRKARPIDIEFNSALVPTLREWESQNDEEAYHDL